MKTVVAPGELMFYPRAPHFLSQPKCGASTLGAAGARLGLDGSGSAPHSPRAAPDCQPTAFCARTLSSWWVSVSSAPQGEEKSHSACQSSQPSFLTSPPLPTGSFRNRRTSSQGHGPCFRSPYGLPQGHCSSASHPKPHGEPPEAPWAL